MIFIAMILALALERYTDFGFLRCWSCYCKFSNIVAKVFRVSTANLQEISTILLLVAGFVLVQAVLINAIPVEYQTLFAGAVLWYCLGPQSLWSPLYSFFASKPDAADEVGSRHAKIQAIFPEIADKLQNLPEYSVDYATTLLSCLFTAVFKRMFVVVFWFAVLGPVGALLYRLIALNNNYDATPNWHKALDILEWLPIRVLGLLYALAGNFTGTMQVYRQYALTGLQNNKTLLSATGNAALGYDQAEPDITNHGNLLKDGVELFNRALIIFLIVIAAVMLIIYKI